jgi:Protein of unknown function (DUF1360)
MKIPDWYSLILIALAAWRSFQLLAFDDILNQPRNWVLRLDPEWKEEGDPVGDEYRLKWALFITCPYCAGFWISLVWFGAWQITPFWTEVVALPFVISSLLVLAHKHLAKNEDTKGPQDDIAEALWALASAAKESARASRR